MSWINILKEMTPEESSKKYLEITNNFMETFIDLDAKFQGMQNKETANSANIKEVLSLLKELKPKLDDYIEELDSQLEGR